MQRRWSSRCFGSCLRSSHRCNNAKQRTVFAHVEGARSATARPVRAWGRSQRGLYPQPTADCRMHTRIGLLPVTGAAVASDNAWRWRRMKRTRKSSRSRRG